MIIKQKIKDTVLFDGIMWSVEEIEKLTPLQQVFFAYFLVLYFYDYEGYDFQSSYHLEICKEIQDKENFKWS